MACTQIHTLEVGFTELQYDPNPRVRDSMTAIWRALVAEPRKAVDEHYSAIMKELLKVSSVSRPVCHSQTSPRTAETTFNVCYTDWSLPSLL